MADTQVSLGGKTYEDEAQAVAMTHPNIPDELRRVYITKDSTEAKSDGDAYTAPALESKPATQVPPVVQTSPAPSYETSLTPEQQTQYTQKFDANASQDYDMQGYFAAHPDVEPNAPGVHYPDTFKKPNHMTFSDESQYHGVDGNQGGHWGTDADGKDTFTPGPTNLQQHTPQELQDYFKRVEPDVKLIMPPASPDYSNPPQHGSDSLVNRPSIINAVKGMMNPSFDEDKKMLGNFYDQVKSAFSLTDAPEWAVDKQTGEVHTSPQAIEKAHDLANLMTFGPAPVAAKMVDGNLGSFMGVQSKTINKGALYKAQNMEMNGSHIDQIWKDTGTFRGADGRWRQEVDDSVAKLNHDNLDVTLPPPPRPVNPSIPKGWQYTGDGDPQPTIGIKSANKTISTQPKTPQEFEKYWGDVIKGTKDKPTIVSDVLDHPELFKAYPDLATIKLMNLKDVQHGLGSNVQGIHTANGIYMKDAAPEEFKSVLMHELQHAIQDKEGFARGGNSGMFKPQALAAPEADFKKIKQETIDLVAKDTGMKHFEAGMAIGALKSQLERGQIPNGGLLYKDLVDRLKDTGHYNKILNIAKAQNILDAAEADWFKKYRSLMGEVEARNVQARMNFKVGEHGTRTNTAPDITEDIKRADQIHHEAVHEHIGNVSASEPVQMRRAANDNTPSDMEDFKGLSKDLFPTQKAADTWDDFTKRSKRGLEIIDERAKILKNLDKRELSEIEEARLNKLLEEHNKLFPK